MKAIIPDEKTLSPDHPIVERDKLVDRSKEISTDPVAWAGERLVGIDKSLEVVSPRPVTKPGNISMHEHLGNLKTRFETDPEGEAAVEVARIDNDIESINQSMEPEVRWP